MPRISDYKLQGMTDIMNLSMDGLTLEEGASMAREIIQSRELLERAAGAFRATVDYGLGTPDIRAWLREYDALTK
jgi:hypothetical protein